MSWIISSSRPGRLLFRAPAKSPSKKADSANASYFYYLDGVTRLVVYFSTRKGEVLRFVVKLEYFCDGKWRELLRHDCFHGYVHKDVLARSGGKKRVVKYGFFDPGTGLNASIADCVENYRSYIERWSNGKP